MRVNIMVIKPSGDKDSLSFERPTELTLGRSSSCQYRLEADPMVSRMHAALIIDPPSIRIRDLNSTNGISINGKQYGGGSTSVEPFELRDGDTVRIGKTLLHIELFRPLADTAAKNIPPPDPDPTHFTLPPEIPGYRLGRLLGHGGMGDVYLAEVEATGEKVAVKILSDKVISVKRIEAFSREIDVTKSINHPNIVRFYGSGIARNGSMYLALEYVSGGDLGAYLIRQPERRLPVKMAYELALQVAQGMTHAHAHGIIHRDIKPQNILLQFDSYGVTAKITDLGLAKTFEDAGIALSASGGFTGGGTLAYMPPEQLLDFREAKTQADVFSLGATFYEMLAGHGPYDFSNGKDMYTVVSRGETIPVEESVPGLPETLVVIIERCLCVEPEDRYQNCGELLDAMLNVML